VVYSALIKPEPYEVKVSSTVLKGQGRSNPPELPNKTNATHYEKNFKYSDFSIFCINIFWTNKTIIVINLDFLVINVI